MISYQEFLRNNIEFSIDIDKAIHEKSTEELYDMFVNRDDLKLEENKILAGALFLRYFNKIQSEKDINKKFKMLLGAIALSSVLTVRDVKRIVKRR